MTEKELRERAMTREEKRVKIAEACGWKFTTHNSPPSIYEEVVVISYNGEDRGSYFTSYLPRYISEQINKAGVPNYFEDLNVMHEAVRTGLTDINLWDRYLETLYELCQNPHICPTTHAMAYVEATAEQRANALGLTLGLWKEGEE